MFSCEPYVNNISMNGTQLKQHRKSLDLTQQELADYLGVTNVHLSRLENGHNTIQRPVELAVLAMVEKANLGRGV